MRKHKGLIVTTLLLAVVLSLGCGQKTSANAGASDTKIKVNGTTASGTSDTKIKVTSGNKSEEAATSEKSTEKEEKSSGTSSNKNSSGSSEKSSTKSGTSSSNTSTSSKKSAVDEAMLAFNTYNGYAWITDNGVDSCYNEKGELQFTLPKGTRAASVFYNGYAAVMQEGERGIAYVSAIIDTKGKTVFDAKKIGADGFIFGIYEEGQKNNVSYDLYNREKKDGTYNDFNDLLPIEDSLLEDGYIFAYTTSESYAGTEFQVGLVNMKGEWVYPLAKDNIATLKEWYTPGALLQNLTYCKEGIWMWATTSYGKLEASSTIVNYYFYSIEENHWSHLIGDNIERYSDTFGLTFEDGIAVAVGSGSSGMSYIPVPKAGEKNFEPENIEIKHSKELGDTYFYNYDQDAHVIFAYAHGGDADHSGDNIVLFDKDLNELFRTDLYSVMSLHDSCNGYMPILITNDKGTQYWTCIGPDGEFLFEPVKEEMHSSDEFYIDDNYIVFLNTDRYGGVSGTVYDLKGKQVKQFEEYTYTDIRYHNGVFKTTAEDMGKVEYLKL